MDPFLVDTKNKTVICQMEDFSGTLSLYRIEKGGGSALCDSVPQTPSVGQTEHIYVNTDTTEKSHKIAMGKLLGTLIHTEIKCRSNVVIL